MKTMKKNTLFAALFVLVFSGLIGLFALGLGKNPNELDFVTKNTKLPAFSLPALLSDETLTNADLTSDKPYYLLNVFASWCAPCHTEHPYLLALGKKTPIYGINWREEGDNGKAFIRRLGNPYRNIIADKHSKLAIELGVVGAPETFLLKADGTILHRYAGALNERVWQAEFVPRIAALE